MGLSLSNQHWSDLTGRYCDGLTMFDIKPAEYILRRLVPDNHSVLGRSWGNIVVTARTLRVTASFCLDMIQGTDHPPLVVDLSIPFIRDRSYMENFNFPFQVYFICCQP